MQDGDAMEVLQSWRDRSQIAETEEAKKIWDHNTEEEEQSKELQKSV